MNEAEIYILTNDLQFYNKLQELNILDEVTAIMNTCIETIQEDKTDERIRKLEFSLTQAESEFEESEDTIAELERDIETLEAKILKLESK